MSSRRLTRSLVAGAAAIAIAGGAYGIVSATSAANPAVASSGSSTSSSGFAHAPGSGVGSSARSGPAAGGAAGTVSSLSTSGFTLTTAAGQKVTIKEASSTTYQKGANAASVSAVTTGEPVLVLGTTDNTTITATQVTVEPASNAYTAASAQVVPFQQGTPTTSKQAGQIPAGYTEGSGTIVSGTAASKATQAALASYPGGLADRVVKLGDGGYEVHYIGVNWPHHVFVSQDFKVAGAD
jgi:membrane-bound inhibitor of C-type lysozyme